MFLGVESEIYVVKLICKSSFLQTVQYLNTNVSYLRNFKGDAICNKHKHLDVQCQRNGHIAQDCIQEFVNCHHQRLYLNQYMPFWQKLIGNYDMLTLSVLLQVIDPLPHFQCCWNFLSYFYILRMSTAKIFTLLFLSENFCCRQSQNIKVRKKTFAVRIPEYQIKKTKFCRQQKNSLKNNKNASKDNIEFGRRAFHTFSHQFLPALKICFRQTLYCIFVWNYTLSKVIF